MIDTHCHLADEAYGGDLDAVVARARAAGVTGSLCILSADESRELDRAADVGRAWPGVRFAAGIHPHRSGGHADSLDAVPRLVGRAIDRTGAAALGEIGLDYHYDLAPRDVQRAVFRAQLDLAVARGLPVVIHTRDAMPDTLALLGEAGPGLRAVLHCFTGTREEADAAVARGAFISLSGIATFPKAAAIRELAAHLPDDRVLIETDAPYLAPVPHRGRRNEPAWIAETYAVVAAARGVAVDGLSALVRDNFQRFLRSDRESSAR